MSKLTTESGCSVASEQYAHEKVSKLGSMRLGAAIEFFHEIQGDFAAGEQSVEQKVREVLHKYKTDENYLFYDVIKDLEGTLHE